MVKGREIVKCAWEDTFGSLLLKFGDGMKAEKIREHFEVNENFFLFFFSFFFYLPPGSHSKPQMSKKHIINLEWPKVDVWSCGTFLVYAELAELVSEARQVYRIKLPDKFAYKL